MRNVFSSICRQRMPRSACASAQSDQGLRCPQTESLGIKDCFSGGQYPDETDDVNPHILRMLKKTFSLDAANL